MTDRYHCPFCNATLNPGTKVVLRGSQGERSGLCLLSPQVGDYASVLPEELALRPGDTLRFSCPVCGADLTSPHDTQLCELLLVRDAAPLRVDFSRVYGEHATFVVVGDQVRRFGDHADKYDTVNFFGVGPRPQDAP